LGAGDHACGDGDMKFCLYIKDTTVFFFHLGVAITAATALYFINKFLGKK